jgi:N-acetyltransferase
MSFDYQPILTGHLVELRPLRAEDYDELCAVSADPLIWEQHPVVIGSSRFHGYNAERSEVEIGWTFLARSHWGRPYNGERKRLMLRHAFRFVRSVVVLIGH